MLIMSHISNSSLLDILKLWLHHHTTTTAIQFYVEMEPWETFIKFPWLILLLFPLKLHKKDEKMYETIHELSIRQRWQHLTDVYFTSDEQPKQTGHKRLIRTVNEHRHQVELSCFSLHVHSGWTGWTLHIHVVIDLLHTPLHTSLSPHSWKHVSSWLHVFYMSSDGGAFLEILTWLMFLL